MAGLYYSET